MELAAVADRLARPQQPQHVERFSETLHAGTRHGAADAERVELGGHRPPADAEVETTAAGVIEADRLVGEQRRMTEHVAQHEVADTQVDVDAATQDAVIIASCIECCSAIGGARWSMNAIPVNPAASAARARSTIASIVSRICGRNR